MRPAMPRVAVVVSVSTRHHVRPCRFHSAWPLYATTRDATTRGSATPGATTRGGPGQEATAQVTAAGRPSGFDFLFGTRSSPPAASAAASATDGVPTAASGAPDGFGTAIPASRPAAYPRTGTPSRAAAPTIPGWSALASTVARPTTESGGSPASRRVSSISPSTSPAEAPLLAPIPTISAGSRSGAGAGAGPGPRSRPGCAKYPPDRLCRGAWRSSSRSARSS